MCFQTELIQKKPTTKTCPYWIYLNASSAWNVFTIQYL